MAKKYGVLQYRIPDDLIESKENKKVRKIFEKKGEQYFRELEAETARWLEKCVKGTLISCGGGFYKVKNLNKIGKVVLLDASFEWIYRRLSESEMLLQKFAKETSI